MKKPKVKINYQKLSVLEIISFVRNSCGLMAAKPEMFANPTVPYDDLLAAVDDLELKYLNSLSGMNFTRTEVTKQKGIVDDLVRKQGLYVEQVAGGDLSIIQNSGFMATKPQVRVRKSTFRVKNGDHSGEMNVRHSIVKGARAWAWEYSVDGVVWTIGSLSTRATSVIKGLKPATKYWFRASSVSPNGQSEWCSPVSDIVK